MNSSHGGRVVLNETISLMTTEDPALTEMRRRGWYLSTGCTVHVCNSRNMFVDYQPLTNHVVILAGSNNHVEVAGIGTVVLGFTTGKDLTLTNVFHIPTVIKCIVSFGRLGECSMTFEADEIVIEDANSHEIIGKGFNEDGLLRLNLVE